MFFHLFILFSFLKKLRINLRGFKKLWICAPLHLYSAERFCIRRLQFLCLEAKNAQLTNPHQFVIQVVVSSKERTWISDTGIARIATVGFMAIFGSPVFQSPLPDTSWFFFSIASACISNRSFCSHSERGDWGLTLHERLDVLFLFVLLAVSIVSLQAIPSLLSSPGESSIWEQDDLSLGKSVFFWCLDRLPLSKVPFSTPWAWGWCRSWKTMCSSSKPKRVTRCFWIEKLRKSMFFFSFSIFIYFFHSILVVGTKQLAKRFGLVGGCIATVRRVRDLKHLLAKAEVKAKSWGFIFEFHYLFHYPYHIWS